MSGFRFSRVQNFLTWFLGLFILGLLAKYLFSDTEITGGTVVDLAGKSFFAGLLWAFLFHDKWKRGSKQDETNK